MRSVNIPVDAASWRKTKTWLAPCAFDLIPLPVGFVCGIAFLYVMGVLLRWTGNRLGGSGEGAAVRAAIAYSLVPLILSEALLALYYFVWPGQTPPSSEFASALELVGATLVIWSLPIFFVSLAEVHKFSIWKALACAGISLAVLTVAYLLCLLVIFAVLLSKRLKHDANRCVRGDTTNAAFVILSRRAARTLSKDQGAAICLDGIQ